MITMILMTMTWRDDDVDPEKDGNDDDDNDGPDDGVDDEE